MKISRRQWVAGAMFSGGAAGFTYGAGVEKRQLSVTRVSVPLGPRHAALAGLTIAALADFHHDDFGDVGLIRRAVETVNHSSVDLVLLLGDYISRDPAAVLPLCRELAALRPRFGTVAILGNHDRGHPAPFIVGALEEAGARVLVDEVATFPGFAVVGMDSYWGGTPNLSRVLREVAPGMPAILAWHEPDTFDRHDDARIALQLSGHTHGGQIRAPFFGPILLPEHGRKYPYGLYRRGSRSLFVTRGIGTLTIPARFFCPPELAMITLEEASRAAPPPPTPDSPAT